MFTLKIARTDRGFVTHTFTDLRACLSALDMLRSAGKVRHAWITHWGRGFIYSN